MIHYFYLKIILEIFQVLPIRIINFVLLNINNNEYRQPFKDDNNITKFDNVYIDELNGNTMMKIQMPFFIF